MTDDLAAALDRVRDLSGRESGLAVAVTTRPDGSPRASVVNAGVLDHPVAGGPVVGFVSRGAVRKLADLRDRPRVTLLFRSGWEWLAVEGVAELAGPDDHLAGLDDDALPRLLRTVYAAAVGGVADDWAGLDEAMTAERHAAVLVRIDRAYPADDGSP